MKGVLERVQRVLREADVMTAFRPILTLFTIFKNQNIVENYEQVKMACV